MAGPRVLFSLNNVRAVKESLITPPVEEKKNRAASFTYTELARAS